MKKVKRFQTGNTDVSFFGNLDPHNSRLNRKKVVIPKKKCFVTRICLIWKLTEYTNDRSPDAPIIPTYITEVTPNLLWKSCIGTFNYYVITK